MAACHERSIRFRLSLLSRIGAFAIGPAMSLDESSPFLGMTMKISVATGQPVDMARDAMRIDFIGKACLGIEGALSRNDRNLAERLRMAIEMMQGNQGQAISIDTRA